MNIAFRYPLCTAVLAALCALAALPCRAAETVYRDPAPLPYRPVARGDLIQLERGPGDSLGGELVVFGVVGAIGDGLPWPSLQDAPRFDTFSVERGEPLEFGVTYRVARISRRAHAGGLGGRIAENRKHAPRDETFDPLDPRTAWLYEQFHFQRLSPYAYDDYSSPGAADALPLGLRNPHAAELQRAIWFLENELEARDPIGGQSLGYEYDATDMGIARATLGAESLAYRWVSEADAAVRDRLNTIGHRVRVLTLVDEHSGRIQDVLMVLPFEPVAPIRESALVGPAASDSPIGGIFASAYTANFTQRGGSGQPSDPGTPSGPSGDPSPKPRPKPRPTPGPLPVPTPEPGSLLIWGICATAAAAWARKRARAASPSSN